MRVVGVLLLVLFGLEELAIALLGWWRSRDAIYQVPLLPLGVLGAALTFSPAAARVALRPQRLLVVLGMLLLVLFTAGVGQFMLVWDAVLPNYAGGGSKTLADAVVDQVALLVLGALALLLTFSFPIPRRWPSLERMAIILGVALMGASFVLVRAWPGIADELERPHVVEGLRSSVDSRAVEFPRTLLSPDGATRAWKGSVDKTARLERVADGALLHTFQHTGVVTDLAFAPDGATLASASSVYGDTVRLWRVADGALLRTLRLRTGSVVLNALRGEWSPRSVAFSSDGATLAIGTSQGAMVLWDLRPITAEVPPSTQTYEPPTPTRQPATPTPPPPTPTPALGPNLAPNPSFELGVAEPTGWRQDVYRDRKQVWETAVAHSGTRSVSVSGATCTPDGRPFTVRWMTTEPIAVGAGQRYQFSVWVRANDPFNVAKGNLSFNVAGTRFDVPPADAPPALEWRLEQRVVEVPLGTTQASIEIGYASRQGQCDDANTVYFDDVEFRLAP